MKDLFLRMLAVFTLAVAAPVLLAADQDAAEQDADQNTEAELQGIVEQWSDAAFNNYVNLDLLSRALATGDASRLTDAALQFLKAEDILLRNHQAVSAEDLVMRAARLAGVQRDSGAIDRLAKATESLKNEKVNATIDAARKQAQESSAASSSVSVKDTSVEEFETYKQLLDQVRAATVVGDQELLKQTRTAVQESGLSEQRKQSLLKSIDESQPEDAMNDALSKLAAVSRYAPEEEYEDPQAASLAAGLNSPGGGGSYGGGGGESYGGGGGESYGGGGGGFDVGGFLGGLLGGGGQSFGGGGNSNYGGGESFGNPNFGGGGNFENFVPSQPRYNPPITVYPPQQPTYQPPRQPAYQPPRQPTYQPITRPQPAPTTKSSNPFARTQPSPAPSRPATTPRPTSTVKSSNPFARRQPTPEPSSPAPKPQPTSIAKSTNPFAKRQPFPAPSSPAPKPQPAPIEKSSNPFAKSSPPKPKPQDPPCGDPSKPLGVAWKKDSDARQCVESGQAHMVKNLINVQMMNPTKKTFQIFSLNQDEKNLSMNQVGYLPPSGDTTLTFPKGTEILLLPRDALRDPQSAIRFEASLKNSVVVLK